LAAVEATDWAIEGTVSEARRDDGRPVRCGTPEADMIVVGGITRVSDLLAVEVDSALLAAFVGLGIVLGVCAALLAAGFLTGVADADLAAGFLAALVAGFVAGLDAVRGTGVLATTLLVVFLAADDFAAVTVPLAGAFFTAGLTFAGVAFTSRLLTEPVYPWLQKSDLSTTDDSIP